MKNNLEFIIGIPTYNGASFVGQALESILKQSFQDFETVISDDCSIDNTIAEIRKYKDKRIKLYRNKKNLGYGRNLQVLKRLAKGDILFLMGQDDILLKDALLKTYNAFLLGEEIGVVTRPYFWFDEDVLKPVRVVRPYSETSDSVISVFDGEKQVQKIFESVGQLSGLAYRIKYLDTPFHEDTFPAHIYPFAAIAKKYKIVYLKDYTVAVRIKSSQARFKSSIYNISPTKSWVRMFNTIFNGDKYKKIRQVGIKQIASHYPGLVQIRTYSTFPNLMREIMLLIKFHWQNIYNPEFWFYSLITIFFPSKLLRWIADNYKNYFLSRIIKNIKIELP